MNANRRPEGPAYIVWGIAVVLAVLLIIYPMIVQRGDSCRKMSCAGNIHECAIGLQTYVNDYDGYLPSSMLVNHSKKWNKQDFLKFATKHGNCPSSANSCKTWPQIMYDHLMNRDTVFCPSDSVDYNNPNSPVSYWWKLAIDKAWYGEGCSKPYRRLDDFPYKQDQIIFYEHIGKADGLKNGLNVHVAYMDTHVKTITIKNATSGDPINCAANSDGEPMYFNFDNEKKASVAGDAPARFVDPGRYSDRF